MTTQLAILVTAGDSEAALAKLGIVDGSTITDHKKIAQYIRIQYADMMGKVLKATDAAIIEYLSDNPDMEESDWLEGLEPDDEKDADGEVIEEIAEENATTETTETDPTKPVNNKNPLVASRIHQGAIAFAAKVSADTVTDLETVSTAAATVTRGPLVAANNLTNDMGLDFILTCPVPGSGGKTPSNNPDIYYEKRIKADGSKRDVKRSFWRDAFDQLPNGQSYHRAIAAIAQAKKDGKVAIISRQTETNRLKTRYNKQWKAFHDGVRYLFQMDAFKQLPKLQAKLVKVKNKEGEMELKDTPTPISVCQLDDMENTLRCITVGTFLKYNIPLAVTNGGTFDALEATLERNDDDDDTAVLLKNPGEVADYGRALSLYFSDDDDGKARAKAFLAMSKKDKTVLLAVGDACVALDYVWKEIEDDYIKASRAVRKAARNAAA